jgi:hypothetical protein
MFASTMLTSSTTALAGSRIAPCSKMAPLGRTSSLMMAVETGDKLVEDNLGAASESGYTFSPGRDQDREQARKMLIELGGYDVESGIGPWDPLNLATVTGDAMDVGARLRWYRQAEIKHGRVSMAAFVGWIVSQNGLSWPGIEKAWVSTNPLETWSNTPWQYQWGFLLSCGIIEYRSLMGNEGWKDWKVNPEGASLTKPDMKLGVAKVPFGWDPIKLGQGKKTEAERAASLISELKNGRLAMVGIASLYVATIVPGSVPFLADSFDWGSAPGLGDAPGGGAVAAAVSSAVAAAASTAEAVTEAVADAVEPVAEAASGL